MENVQLVTAERHSASFWVGPKDYRFCASQHAVPLSAQELGMAAVSMPIGFFESDGGFDVAGMLGFRPSQNLFVAPDGRWLADYLPANFRSHPFRLGRHEQSAAQYYLMIDEGSGLVSMNSGVPLFEDKLPHAKTQELLNFMVSVRQGSNRLRAAAHVLNDLDLLDAWDIEWHDGPTKRTSRGALRVSAAKFAALSDDQFLSLRKTDALALANAQLLSTNNLSKLQKLASTHHAHNERRTAEEATYFTPAMEDEKLDWASILGD